VFVKNRRQSYFLLQNKNAQNLDLTDN